MSVKTNIIYNAYRIEYTTNGESQWFPLKWITLCSAEPLIEPLIEKLRGLRRDYPTRQFRITKITVSVSEEQMCEQQQNLTNLAKYLNSCLQDRVATR